uniref:CCHC-type domain-containing protein n=1 Tax=Tanacetum cinerariifolium TaxID=118510 RepID=A0A6L2N4F5_TANCI|nr:hypothetical protein [Tanacetum cinerariifolium]
MTTPTVTSSTDSQMHNNIMAASSRDRPPMLATGRYPQWRLRFLRYIDTRPNGEALKKCILSGPYKLTTVLVQVVDATGDSSAIPEHTTVKTPMNMTPENKAHFEAEKEAIHLILTGIRDEIYSIYFKTIYKPTNNNLRTSLNLRNKNVDTTSWFKNDNQSGQFGNQRTVNVAGARENVGSLVVQQYGVQCFNCKKFGHFPKECKKPKRVKDSAYHKEKMLLCKQAEQGVPLQAEQYDWLADTDEEVDEQELEAHYSYMAKIQEVPTADSGTDSELVEQVHNDGGYNVFANDLQHSEQSESVRNICLVETHDSNVIPDSPGMCKDDIQNVQNDVESVDKRVVLANLIANLKLDVDENKKIQNQLKKANTTLAQELKECKTILVETSKSLGESISVRDSCLVALQTKQAEFEKYNAFNDRTIDYDKLEHKLNEALGQLALKDIEIKEGLKTKAYELSVVKEKHDELMKQSLLTKSHYEGLVKQKMKGIMDLKLNEEYDIEKMLSIEKQLKFLNKIVYKRSQSIQTIHMMAPKVPTYNVVSAVQGNRKNVVKSSACWIWRPTENVIDHILKDSGSYMLKRFNYVDLQVKDRVVESSKRLGEELESDNSKKQKLDDNVQAKVADDDTADHKRCMEIVPKDDDEVTIKATPLSFKSPTIVDYKIYKERKKTYHKIIREDGNSQNYLTFGIMFKNFNKEDLEVLRIIVKIRFEKTKLVNDMDNLLFQTLKTMFEHHVQDNIWKYQQGAFKVHN